MYSVNKIFERLIEKNKTNEEKMVLFKNKKWNKITYSEELMNEIEKISELQSKLEYSLNLLNDQVILNNQEEDNSNEAREIKINNYINKKLVPLMIYMRICIMNNMIEID
tara:strand:- start:227 stop:556 length:330 start_codon:yes stop_codon:yes gene_type:complete